MSKIVLAALAAALVLTVSASAGSGPKLTTFGTGHAFVNGDECATFNASGEYGGCYRNKTSNKTLDRVHLSFTSGADVGGGAPRLSIPVDENKDNMADGYAFIDVNGCGSNVVSTDSANCTVYYKSETHANWAAFIASHPHGRDMPGAPAWRIARKDGGEATEPFIIADVQGDYLVTDVSLSY